MPIRKISILKTGYHARGESEDARKYLRFVDVKDGITFRQILENEWDTSTFAELGLKAQDRAIDLLNSEELEGALLLSGMVGRVGEPGRLKETSNDEVIREDATGTLTKQSLLRIAYFELDPDPIHGYFVIEQTPNGALSAALQKILRNGFKAVNPKLTVDFVYLQNNEQWAETIAQLEEIQIVREKQSLDADGIGETGLQEIRTQISLRPTKGRSKFAPEAWRNLRSGKLDPHDLIGFPLPEEEDEVDRIRVKLGDGDRSKVMDLDDLRGLNYQAIITDYGEETPSDKEFVQTCRNHLSTLLGSSSSR